MTIKLEPSHICCDIFLKFMAMRMRLSPWCKCQEHISYVKLRDEGMDQKIGSSSGVIVVVVVVVVVAGCPLQLLC